MTPKMINMSHKSDTDASMVSTTPVDPLFSVMTGYLCAFIPRVTVNVKDSPQ